MKTKLTVILLLIGTVAFAQTFQVDTSEAEPWWKQVDQTQALLVKWITMLTMVATVLVGAIFTVWALLKSKVDELKASHVREREDTRVLQAQVNAVAIATDPTKTSSGRPAKVEVVNSPSQPVPTIEKKP